VIGRVVIVLMLGLSSRDAIRVVRDMIAGLTIVFVAPFPVIVAQCGPYDNWDPEEDDADASGARVQSHPRRHAVRKPSPGRRYYAERPSGGPDWGLRFVVTFLFPKK
jgi:hypothetical protein